MTDVYITRKGAKYHAHRNCASLLQVERERGEPLDRRLVPLKGLHHEPCSVCWPDTSGYDPWKQLAQRVEREGDSIYEARFVDLVLRNVKGLRPGDVDIQKETYGESGQSYRVDFVLRTQSGDRILVEIDGTDKAPGQKAIAQVQRDIDSKRADLMDAGWRVLNFSNERVVNRSTECVRELESTLSTPLRAKRSSTVQPPGLVTTPGTSPEPREPTRSGGSRSTLTVVLGVVMLVGVAAWIFSQGGTGTGSHSPQGSSCPSGAPIKGNISEGGDKIYHEPGWRYYSATWPEACFETASDAERDGFRQSKVR